jgi:hypothetical protein
MGPINTRPFLTGAISGHAAQPDVRNSHNIILEPRSLVLDLIGLEVNQVACSPV